jgi:isopenicillin-N epimerase
MTDETSGVTRRGLLQGAALAAAVPAIAADPDKADLRGELLLAPDLLYFNAANIAPTFRSVIAAQEREQRAFQTDPSREHREAYPIAADRLRARLGRRLGVTAEEIALVRNSSEANTVAVLGLDLKPGDEVIVTDHNHQSTLDSWRLRAKRDALVVKVLPTPFAATSPQAIADDFARAVTPRTKAIFLSHVTNVTGLLYPVGVIADVARKAGAWLHVDGAQTVGWMRLDLARLGVDSYSGSTHKWLMGPLEAGLLYVRRDRQDHLAPTMLSHGYWLTDPRNMETAQRYEVLGQRDDPKLVAIEATLDRLDALGEAWIEAQTRTKAAGMRGILAGVPGARIVGSGDPAVSGPIVTVAFPGRDVGAMRAALWKSHRLATAQAVAGGDALIRFSPHIYNSRDEMDRVAASLAKM